MEFGHDSDGRMGPRDSCLPMGVVEGKGVQDLEGRTARIVSRISERNPELGKLVGEWHDSLRASMPNPKSRLVKLNRVHRWLRWAEYPSLDRAVERIEGFFGFLDDVTLEERQGIQSVLRQFVRWAKRPVPDVLSWRVHGVRRQLVRDDLLTDEEVQALINVADHPRDRAFLAVLWDTGARIDEVCHLRYGDVRPHAEYRLYPPGDLATMVDRVRDLAGDESKRQAFGRAARRSVVHRSWRSITNELIGHYSSAIESYGFTSAPREGCWPAPSVAP